MPADSPGSAVDLVSTFPAPNRPSAIARRCVIGGLDVTIAFYAIALALILVTGGLDLGWLSLRQPAKPFLVLWILVPIRVALHLSWPGGPFDHLARTAHQAVSTIVARIPPAVRDVTFVFVVTRLASISVGFLVNLLFPTSRARPFDLPFENAKLAEIFAAWDSGWYFDIATRGYYHSETGQSSIAFFPLYPLAMRALAWPFGSSDAAVWLAGIVISSSTFYLGLLSLYGLTHRVVGDREVARRAVLYVSIFPFSFFLSRVYPSGLFFLLTVLAVNSAYRSRWFLAGACGALAALTRPQGVLIAVPLLLMALRTERWRDLPVRVLALVPIPAAFLGYNLYIAQLAGEPLAWLSTENQWGYSLGHPPWEQLLALVDKLGRYGFYDYFFTSNLAAFRLFHGAAALFFIVATPAVFRTLGAPLGSYVLVSLLVPLSGNALEGIGRYGAVLFPVFIVLATVKSPRFHEALLIIWSAFLTLFVSLFVTWHPIY